MSPLDRVLNAADRVARRFTLWKLTRDLRGWTPALPIEPLAEAERWTDADGVLVVLEQDVDRERKTTTLSLDGLHRLLTAAGYVRTDNLSPEDAS